MSTSYEKLYDLLENVEKAHIEAEERMFDADGWGEETFSEQDNKDFDNVRGNFIKELYRIIKIYE